jgi:hypothetical protein
LKTEREKMKALLITAAFLGAWWAAETMPVTISAIIGLTILAGFFAGAVALGVKWVRNV